MHSSLRSSCRPCRLRGRSADRHRIRSCGVFHATATAFGLAADANHTGLRRATTLRPSLISSTTLTSPESSETRERKAIGRPLPPLLASAEIVGATMSGGFGQLELAGAVDVVEPRIAEIAGRFS